MAVASTQCLDVEPEAAGWFCVREVADGVWVVGEPPHLNSFDRVGGKYELDNIRLFAGDAVSTGAIYAQGPESDVPVLAALARRIAELAPGLRLVCVHHFQRAIAPLSLLRAVADGFERVLAGEAWYRPNRDCAGQAVREAVVGDVTIFLPVKEASDDR